MTSGNSAIEIKLISHTDLLSNKEILIELLKDNLIINFPNLKTVTEYATNGYDDMARYQQDNSAILVGAFEQKKIVGLLWAHKRDVLGEVRVHIGHIIVKSEIRTNGIGSKLLHYLENICRQDKVNKIELMTSIDNENTMKFYKSKGYSTVRVQFEKELGDINDN